MALTASATLVVTPDGTWNPNPPQGHHGWNNTSGDKAWVPDDQYYRRVLLELTSDTPGELGNGIVNWEIYGGSDITFVADASVVADVSPDPTTDPAPGAAFANDLTTRTVWVRVSDDPGVGNPFFEDSGVPWNNSALRANGNRVVIEFPVYLRWDEGVGLDSAEFYIDAFLPGSFGKPSASTSITISKPDIALIGDTGAVQPRDEQEPEPDAEGDHEEKKPRRRKKKDAEALG